VADAREARAVVVGAIEPPGLGVDDRVDARGLRGRDAEPDPARMLWETSAAELGPRGPAVRRLEEAAARSARRRIDVPRRPPRLPERRVDDARVAGTEREVDRARVVVPVQHLLPRLAAVLGAEDAALRARPVRMPERRDEDAVRVLRVDQDAADLLRVAE